MGLPIFSTLLLFAVFYAAAIRLRRRGDAHKRLMLLASASALGAATFRIFVAIFGFEPRVWIAGLLAPNLLIFAAIAHDYRREQKIHPVYRYGLPLTLGLEGGMILLVLTPRGDIVKQGLAWVGRLLGPLY